METTQKKYSIFERGMHWVMLALTSLSIIRMILTLHPRNLNEAIGWGGNEENWLYIILLLHVPMVLVIIIYLLIYFLGRKTKKNISVLFSIILFILILFPLIQFGNMFESLYTFLRWFMILLFIINISSTEKIHQLNNEMEDILDYE